MSELDTVSVHCTFVRSCCQNRHQLFWIYIITRINIDVIVTDANMITDLSIIYGH